jgi:hypothetical protein
MSHQHISDRVSKSLFLPSSESSCGWRYGSRLIPWFLPSVSSVRPGAKTQKTEALGEATPRVVKGVKGAAVVDPAEAADRTVAVTDAGETGKVKA